MSFLSKLISSFIALTLILPSPFLERADLPANAVHLAPSTQLFDVHAPSPADRVFPSIQVEFPDQVKVARQFQIELDRTSRKRKGAYIKKSSLPHHEKDFLLLLSNLWFSGYYTDLTLFPPKYRSNPGLEIIIETIILNQFWTQEEKDFVDDLMNYWRRDFNFQSIEYKGSYIRRHGLRGEFNPMEIYEGLRNENDFFDPKFKDSMEEIYSFWLATGFVPVKKLRSKYGILSKYIVPKSNQILLTLKNLSGSYLPLVEDPNIREDLLLWRRTGVLRLRTFDQLPALHFSIVDNWLALEDGTELMKDQADKLDRLTLYCFLKAPLTVAWDKEFFDEQVVELLKYWHLGFYPNFHSGNRPFNFNKYLREWARELFPSYPDNRFETEYKKLIPPAVPETTRSFLDPFNKVSKVPDYMASWEEVRNQLADVIKTDFKAYGLYRNSPGLTSAREKSHDTFTQSESIKREILINEITYFRADDGDVTVMIKFNESGKSSQIEEVMPWRVWLSLHLKGFFQSHTLKRVPITSKSTDHPFQWFDVTGDKEGISPTFHELRKISSSLPYGANYTQQDKEKMVMGEAAGMRVAPLKKAISRIYYYHRRRKVDNFIEILGNIDLEFSEFTLSAAKKCLDQGRRFHSDEQDVERLFFMGFMRLPDPVKKLLLKDDDILLVVYSEYFKSQQDDLKAVLFDDAVLSRLINQYYESDNSVKEVIKRVFFHILDAKDLSSLMRKRLSHVITFGGSHQEIVHKRYLAADDLKGRNEEEKDKIPYISFESGRWANYFNRFSGVKNAALLLERHIRPYNTASPDSNLSVNLFQMIDHSFNNLYAENREGLSELELSFIRDAAVRIYTLHLLGSDAELGQEKYSLGFLFRGSRDAMDKISDWVNQNIEKNNYFFTIRVVLLILMSQNKEYQSLNHEQLESAEKAVISFLERIVEDQYELSTEAAKELLLKKLEIPGKDESLPPDITNKILDQYPVFRRNLLYVKDEPLNKEEMLIKKHLYQLGNILGRDAYWGFCLYPASRVKIIGRSLWGRSTKLLGTRLHGMIKYLSEDTVGEDYKEPSSDTRYGDPAWAEIFKSLLNMTDPGFMTLEGRKVSDRRRTKESEQALYQNIFRRFEDLNKKDPFFTDRVITALYGLSATGRRPAHLQDGFIKLVHNPEGIPIAPLEQDLYSLDHLEGNYFIESLKRILSHYKSQNHKNILNERIQEKLYAALIKLITEQPETDSKAIREDLLWRIKNSESLKQVISNYQIFLLDKISDLKPINTIHELEDLVNQIEGVKKLYKEVLEKDVDEWLEEVSDLLWSKIDYLTDDDTQVEEALSQEGKKIKPGDIIREMFEKGYSLKLQQEIIKVISISINIIPEASIGGEPEREINNVSMLSWLARKVFGSKGKNTHLYLYFRQVKRILSSAYPGDVVESIQMEDFQLAVMQFREQAYERIVYEYLQWRRNHLTDRLESHQKQIHNLRRKYFGSDVPVPDSAPLGTSEIDEAALLYGGALASFEDYADKSIQNDIKIKFREASLTERLSLMHFERKITKINLNVLMPKYLRFIRSNQDLNRLNKIWETYSVHNILPPPYVILQMQEGFLSFCKKNNLNPDHVAQYFNLGYWLKAFTEQERRVLLRHIVSGKMIDTVETENFLYNLQKGEEDVFSRILMDIERSENGKTYPDGKGVLKSLKEMGMLSLLFRYISKDYRFKELDKEDFLEFVFGQVEDDQMFKDIFKKLFEEVESAVAGINPEYFDDLKKLKEHVDLHVIDVLKGMEIFSNYIKNDIEGWESYHDQLMARINQYYELVNNRIITVKWVQSAQSELQRLKGNSDILGEEYTGEAWMSYLDANKNYLHEVESELAATWEWTPERISQDMLEEALEVAESTQQYIAELLKWSRSGKRRLYGFMKSLTRIRRKCESFVKAHTKSRTKPQTKKKSDDKYDFRNEAEENNLFRNNIQELLNRVRELFPEIEEAQLASLKAAVQRYQDRPVNVIRDLVVIEDIANKVKLELQVQRQLWTFVSSQLNKKLSEPDTSSFNKELSRLLTHTAAYFRNNPELNIELTIEDYDQIFEVYRRIQMTQEILLESDSLFPSKNMAALFRFSNIPLRRLIETAGISINTEMFRRHILSQIKKENLIPLIDLFGDDPDGFASAVEALFGADFSAQVLNEYFNFEELMAPFGGKDVGKSKKKREKRKKRKKRKKDEQFVKHLQDERKKESFDELLNGRLRKIEMVIKMFEKEGSIDEGSEAFSLVLEHAKRVLYRQYADKKKRPSVLKRLQDKIRQESRLGRRSSQKLYEALLLHFQDLSDRVYHSFNGERLEEYQKIGIEFIRANNAVLLADEMGTGKTIMTLTSIFEEALTDGVIDPEKLKKTLFVLPNTLLSKWVNEIKSKYSEQLVDSIYVFDGTDTRYKRPEDALADPKIKLVLINYEKMPKYKHKLIKWKHDILVTDEAHRIRNPKTTPVPRVKGVKYHRYDGAEDEKLSNYFEKAFQDSGKHTFIVTSKDGIAEWRKKIAQHYPEEDNWEDRITVIEKSDTALSTIENLNGEGQYVIFEEAAYRKFVQQLKENELHLDELIRGEDSSEQKKEKIDILWDKQKQKQSQARSVLDVSASRPNAKKIALTGTPLVNAEISEIWALLKFLQPGKDESGTPYVEDYQEFIKKYEGKKGRRLLHRRLRNVMLRRKKEEVLQLPPKTQNEPLVVHLMGRQHELYTDATQEKTGSFLSDSALLRKMLIDPDIRTGKEIASNMERTNLMEGEMPAKYKALIEMVRERLKKKQKIVIFAYHKDVALQIQKIIQFEKKKMLGLSDTGRWEQYEREVTDLFEGDAAEEYKRENDFGVEVIKQEDSTSMRLLKSRNFQNNPLCDVCVTTFLIGGEGIDLTGASSVIFTELPWTPYLLAQAQDRVHRWGQKLPVSIDTIIAEGTIEDKFIELLEAKNLSFEEIIEGKFSDKDTGRSFKKQLIKQIYEDAARISKRISQKQLEEQVVVQSAEIQSMFQSLKDRIPALQGNKTIEIKITNALNRGSAPMRYENALYFSAELAQYCASLYKDSRGKNKVYYLMSALLNSLYLEEGVPLLSLKHIFLREILFYLNFTLFTADKEMNGEWSQYFLQEGVQNNQRDILWGLSLSGLDELNINNVIVVIIQGLIKRKEEVFGNILSSYGLSNDIVRSQVADLVAKDVELMLNEFNEILEDSKDKLYNQFEKVMASAGEIASSLKSASDKAKAISKLFKKYQLQRIRQFNLSYDDYPERLGVLKTAEMVSALVQRAKTDLSEEQFNALSKKALKGRKDLIISANGSSTKDNEIEFSIGILKEMIKNIRSDSLNENVNEKRVLWRKKLELFLEMLESDSDKKNYLQIFRFVKDIVQTYMNVNWDDLLGYTAVLSELRKDLGDNRYFETALSENMVAFDQTRIYARRGYHSPEKVKEEKSLLEIIQERKGTEYEIKEVVIKLDFISPGFVGTSEWFEKKVFTDKENMTAMRIQLSEHENRLLKHGMLDVLTPGGAEILKKIKSMGVRVVGITPRSIVDEPHISQILQSQGSLFDKVIYAGGGGQQFVRKIQNHLKKDSEEGYRLYIDSDFDRSGFILDQFYRQKMRGILWVKPDLPDPSQYLNLAQNALRDGNFPLAEEYWINALDHAASQPKSVDTFLKIGKKIQRYSKAQDVSDLLKMYLETVSAFLYERQNEPDEPGEKMKALIHQYFSFFTMNPEHFCEYFINKRLKLTKAMNFNRARGHSFGIQINEENAYLFLEPMLNWIIREKPAKVLVIETGATPFLPLIQAFIDKYKLDTQVISIPVSVHTALDGYESLLSFYKLAREYQKNPWSSRWASLTIHQRYELMQMSALFPIEGKIAILDDNVISGKTVKLLDQLLLELGADETGVLTAYASNAHGVELSAVASTGLNVPKPVEQEEWQRFRSVIHIAPRWENRNERHLIGLLKRRPGENITRKMELSEKEKELKERFERQMLDNFMSDIDRYFEPDNTHERLMSFHKSTASLNGNGSSSKDEINMSDKTLTERWSEFQLTLGNKESPWQAAQLLEKVVGDRIKDFDEWQKEKGREGEFLSTIEKVFLRTKEYLNERLNTRFEKLLNARSVKRRTRRAREIRIFIGKLQSHDKSYTELIENLELLAEALKDKKEKLKDIINMYETAQTICLKYQYDPLVRALLKLLGKHQYEERKVLWKSLGESVLLSKALQLEKKWSRIKPVTYNIVPRKKITKDRVGNAGKWLYDEYHEWEIKEDDQVIGVISWVEGVTEDGKKAFILEEVSLQKSLGAKSDEFIDVLIEKIKNKMPKYGFKVMLSPANFGYISKDFEMRRAFQRKYDFRRYYSGRIDLRLVHSLYNELEKLEKEEASQDKLFEFIRSRLEQIPRSKIQSLHFYQTYLSQKEFFNKTQKVTKKLIRLLNSRFKSLNYGQYRLLWNEPTEIRLRKNQPWLEMVYYLKTRIVNPRHLEILEEMEQILKMGLHLSRAQIKHLEHRYDELAESKDSILDALISYSLEDAEVRIVDIVKEMILKRKDYSQRDMKKFKRRFEQIGAIHIKPNVGRGKKFHFYLGQPRRVIAQVARDKRRFIQISSKLRLDTLFKEIQSKHSDTLEPLSLSDQYLLVPDEDFQYRVYRKKYNSDDWEQIPQLRIGLNMDLLKQVKLMTHFDEFDYLEAVLVEEPAGTKKEPGQSILDEGLPPVEIQPETAVREAEADEEVDIEPGVEDDNLEDLELIRIQGDQGSFSKGDTGKKEHMSVMLQDGQQVVVGHKVHSRSDKRFAHFVKQLFLPLIKERKLKQVLRIFNAGHDNGRYFEVREWFSTTNAGDYLKKKAETDSSPYNKETLLEGIQILEHASEALFELMEMGLAGHGAVQWNEIFVSKKPDEAITAKLGLLSEASKLFLPLYRKGKVETLEHVKTYFDMLPGSEVELADLESSDIKPLKYKAELSPLTKIMTQNRFYDDQKGDELSPIQDFHQKIISGALTLEERVRLATGFESILRKDIFYSPGKQGFFCMADQLLRMTGNPSFIIYRAQNKIEFDLSNPVGRQFFIYSVLIAKAYFSIVPFNAESRENARKQVQHIFSKWKFYVESLGQTSALTPPVELETAI